MAALNARLFFGTVLGPNRKGRISPGETHRGREERNRDSERHIQVDARVMPGLGLRA